MKTGKLCWLYGLLFLHLSLSQHEAVPQPQAKGETEAIFEPEGEDMQVPHLAEHAAVDNILPNEQI